MIYIKQKGADVIVDTKDFKGELSEHPAILEHPELFEIVSKLPNKYDVLDYIPPPIEEQIN
jgi:hypothetical protein